MDLHLSALTTTCKHLGLQRDASINKLRKQKHAAHTMCHRLRQKLRKLELSHRFLLAIYVVEADHNRLLCERIRQAAQEELANLAELNA